MTANIIAFPKDATPDEALERCKGDYQSVFILGVDSDGMIQTDGAGPMTTLEAIGLLETMKFLLLAGDDE